MSGAELIAVLGVAASAAQLIDYSLKAVGTISEIYTRVKEAPKRVARYTTQINQIVAAGRAIEEHKDLQTSLIDSQLQNTLIEVKHLLQVLAVIRRDYTSGSSSKRVWKAFVGSKEKRMLTCFERLEKEKTALILCISVVNTQALQTIGTGVEILINRDMGNTNDKKKGSCLSDKLKKSRKSKVKNTAVIPSDLEVAVAVMPSGNPLALRGPATSDSGYAQSDPIQPTEGQPKESQHCKERQIFKNVTAFEKATQYNGNINENKKSSHIYKEVKAHTKSFQHNGNRGSSGTHKYTNLHATTRAVQINGNIAKKMTGKEIKELTERQNRDDSDAEGSDEQGSDEQGSDEQESVEQESEEEESDGED